MQYMQEGMRNSNQQKSTFLGLTSKVSSVFSDTRN